MFRHKRPQYKKGDAVLWMNGVYKVFFVYEVEPLHCPDACQAYTLSDVLLNFREFRSTELELHYHVSEEVLEPISKARRFNNG